MFGLFRKAPSLSTYNAGLSRDVLIQSGRLLFVDDEDVPLIEQLKHAGLAVDHDRKGNEFEVQVINQTYDVVILDHSGVGSTYGVDQGLDLLRFLRRVSPRSRIIAYTSKALKSGESDFFRLADAVLTKDAGMRESLEVVEEQLLKAFEKQHLFDALMAKVSVTSSGERARLQKVLEKSLYKNDQTKIKDALKRIAGAAAEKGVDVVISRLFIS
ncbi:hypothetical protein ACTJIL_03275 [Luteimonas sp. 22616]|uniref:hypothetical protein n=1 Tax=Luteimonas sp. 22616 TaxID=3453951 RepID=UPI003F85CE3B